MSPVLRTGDMIYVETVKADDLAVGDIVLFKRANDMVAHRLIKIGRENRDSAHFLKENMGAVPIFSRLYLYWTKGDAFSSPDEPVSERDIIGRVYAVGKHGKMLDLRKGMFSLLNRLAHKLSPLTASFYGAVRRFRDITAIKDMGAKSREHMFVISLLKSAFSGGMPGLTSLKGPIDLPKTLEIARENGVSQKLYTILKKTGTAPIFISRTWETSLVSELRRDYLFSAARNTLIYTEFKRVIEGFGESGLDVMAMKGIVLAELIYRDIGVRSMSDVDLLIRKQDIQKVDALLNKLGYSAVDPCPFDGACNEKNYLTTRDYRSGNPRRPSFHIHWHMVNSSVPAPYASKINMDRIWKEALPVNISGVPVLTMSPHHFLLHLCEHAMRVTHSASRLVYLMDIAASISGYGDDLDWRKVIDSGREWGLEGFAHTMLTLCGLNMGVGAPGWVLDELKREKRGIGKRLFLYLTSRGNGFPGLSYPIHLAMNKGVAAKASFIFRTVFPPAWVLEKRDPSGHKKTVLLYLHRIREISSRAFTFQPPRLKKTGIALLAITALFFTLAVSFASGTAIEKNSTYTTESGLPEYLIAVGDILDVKVWRGFEEKKYEAVVKTDGFITVGVVDVKAGDRTVRQVETDLRTALSEYIKEPKTEVVIREYRGRTATLLGAVQTPAKQYQLKGKMTLSQLVIMSGGFTKEADMENVQITKPDGRIIRANLFQVMVGGDVLNDIVLDNGDAVYVPVKPETEEKNVFIFGEVNTPGVQKFTPGLTLIQAIGKAGGQKEAALIDEIRVIRGGLDTPRIIASNVRAIFEEGDMTKDIRLEKNDIIYVPRSKIGNWNTFISKIRPTLDLLILPFAGTQIIKDVIKGRQQ
ncbi:MAG: nucleotidyltransferase family protein [Deltaproteobacteria bacterium]|nr:nucleotidyltransferase family protein [Deltaproteobacteria bacterium]